MSHMRRCPLKNGFAVLTAASLMSACTVSAATEPRTSDVPTFAKWAPIELRFKGPASRSRGEPNPFAIRFGVTFTSPRGIRYAVPGFYDGDGEGGPDGRVWKVRFSADEVGVWRYASNASHDLLDDRRGSFRVLPVPDEAQGFRRWGRLEAVGTPQNRIRYLKFRDGPYWLKAGCDDPENFLGRFAHYDTLAKRKRAVDYLAAHGINSLYILAHNIDGDHNDVWPWLGETPSEAKRNAIAGNVRFSIPRLSEWRLLFEYMQIRGVVPYLVLEDDSAWKDYDHRRYYREMIARFGDLPAVVFNIGEEHNENYTLAQALEWARVFKEIDPYGHPLAIHNVNTPVEAYIDSPYVDLTSIQTGSPGRRGGLDIALSHNRIAVDWISRCHKRGRRVLVVGFDEGRPEEDRHSWWSAYLGGGVWEAHILPPYDRPHRAWEHVWKELGGARAFMESLPFWQMHPRNDLVKQGRAFCLARPGAAYALYLPTGGSVRIELQGGTSYDVDWWSPKQGWDGRFRYRRRVSGGLREFTAPSPGDWALRILAVPAE